MQHESPPNHPFVCQLRHNRRKRRKWRPLRRTKVWNQKRGECWGWELHVHAHTWGLIQCAASLQIRYEIGAAVVVEDDDDHEATLSCIDGVDEAEEEEEEGVRLDPHVGWWGG